MVGVGEESGARLQPEKLGSLALDQSALGVVRSQRMVSDGPS